jgi:hypothetical protein
MGTSGHCQDSREARLLRIFVTFGKRQGAHSFDESVTEDGVLTWQSQPKQGLADPYIEDFISHDHRTHTIYLFLRTRRDVPLHLLRETGIPVPRPRPRETCPLPVAAAGLASAQQGCSRNGDRAESRA